MQKLSMFTRTRIFLRQEKILTKNRGLGVKISEFEFSSNITVLNCGPDQEQQQHLKMQTLKPDPKPIKLKTQGWCPLIDALTNPPADSQCS